MHQLRPNLGKVTKGVAHEVLHRTFLESFNIHEWLHTRGFIKVNPYEMVMF